VVSTERCNAIKCVLALSPLLGFRYMRACTTFMCIYLCAARLQAAELGGTDPDYATRDLYNAIASGDFPSWTAYIQVRAVAVVDN
jgi:Catalase